MTPDAPPPPDGEDADLRALFARTAPAPSPADLAPLRAALRRRPSPLSSSAPSRKSPMKLALTAVTALCLAVAAAAFWAGRTGRRLRRRAGRRRGRGDDPLHVRLREPIRERSGAGGPCPTGTVRSPPPHRRRGPATVREIPGRRSPRPSRPLRTAAPTRIAARGGRHGPRRRADADREPCSPAGGHLAAPRTGLAGRPPHGPVRFPAAPARGGRHPHRAPPNRRRRRPGVPRAGVPGVGRHQVHRPRLGSPGHATPAAVGERRAGTGTPRRTGTVHHVHRLRVRPPRPPGDVRNRHPAGYSLDLEWRARSAARHREWLRERAERDAAKSETKD